MIDEIVVICTVATAVLTLINSYWAYKRTCYGRDTLKGSTEYWGSWDKRSKDVAEKVLKEISTLELEKELQKRYAKKRKKKSRKARARDAQSTKTTT